MPRSIPTLVSRVILLVVLLATPVFAAERPNPAAAREVFEEAERAYHLGRFEDAIGAYERAYALDPQPAVLLNIALANRRQFEVDGKLERLRLARELYRNYLRLEPASTRRPAVERQIDELGARLERAAPPPPAPPTVVATAPPPAQPVAPAAVSAAPPPEPARKGSGALVWVILGSVAVAGGLAVALLLSRGEGRTTDGPTVNLGGPPR